MSRQLEEKEERILKILKSLSEESANGTPIIVEGKKDVETLRTLGVAGIILSAKTGGKSFLDITTEIEQMRVSEVIFFLDFDRRGRRGTKCLKQLLEHAKIKPNITFWLDLKATVRKDIPCIEGLVTYLSTLRKKIRTFSNQDPH